MKLPKRPPEGWPWEQPGHRFWTPGFPPGYVPHLADDACRISVSSRIAIAAAAARGNAAQRANEFQKVKP